VDVLVDGEMYRGDMVPTSPSTWPGSSKAGWCALREPLLPQAHYYRRSLLARSRHARLVEVRPEPDDETRQGHADRAVYRHGLVVQ